MALDGTRHAIQLANELLASPRFATMAPELQALTHYFVANAWYGVDHLDPEADARAWDWHAEPLERQIFHLRSALAMDVLDPARQCRVHTNLGSALDRVGRTVEAVECYDQALALDPKYGMPVGNRGVALESFAYGLPDIGHVVFVLRHAAAALTRASKLPVDAPGVEEQFARNAAAIRAKIKGYRLARRREYSLGKSKAERAYRAWVLRERLFLNPLNDLGELLIAAHDPLSPVSIVMPLGKGPYLFSYFNSLKQEFVSARFLLYQGLRRHGRHFSDRGVKLSDTLDDSVRGLGMEKVKAAFRVAYSLLDKVAFFLNDYFTLRIRHQDVSFRDLWYEPKKKGAAKDATRVLRSQFVDAENLPLRGLFWISKDLADQREDRQAVLAPDSQEIVRIRNHLEHKNLRLVAGLPAGLYPDPLAHVLRRGDFERKTIRIMKHARAALIHLACAVAVEERLRARNRNGPTPPMPLIDRSD
jgi:tetratricopeptide (TPR) repeat protein